MDVCVCHQGLTVGWWKEERHSSDTTATSAGFESQAGWAAHGCCVLLYSCCVVQKKGERRRGQADRKRYLIGQVVKGERLLKKKKNLKLSKYLKT
jgi:hypothetical protein